MMCVLADSPVRSDPSSMSKFTNDILVATSALSLVLCRDCVCTKRSVSKTRYRVIV